MNIEQRLGREISRRSFLKATTRDIGIITIASAGLTLVNYGGVLEVIADTFSDTYQILKESEERLREEGYVPSEVKDFALDIVFSSRKIVSAFSDPLNLRAIAGYYSGNTIINYLEGEEISDVVDRGIGAVALPVANAIDLESTINFAAPMQDPRFKEYGLDKYLGEQSILYGEHPDPEDIRRTRSQLQPFLIAFGFAIPALGRGYLGGSPFIALDNADYRRIIEKSIELGDGVKMVLGNGGNPQDVNDYLNFQVELANEGRQAPQP